MSHLLQLSSMSGGGKSTFANENFEPRFILPDTNKSIHEMYHKLLLDPGRSQEMEIEELTSFHMLAVKFTADNAYLDGIERSSFTGKIHGDFITMRPYVDYFVFDKIYKQRDLIPLKEVLKYQDKLNSRFESVSTKLFILDDDVLIEEMMSVDDDRAWLFKYSKDYYKSAQDIYVRTYTEISKTLGVDLEIEVRNYKS